MLFNGPKTENNPVEKGETKEKKQESLRFNYQKLDNSPKLTLPKEKIEDPDLDLTPSLSRFSLFDEDRPVKPVIQGSIIGAFKSGMYNALSKDCLPSYIKYILDNHIDASFIDQSEEKDYWQRICFFVKGLCSTYSSTEILKAIISHLHRHDYPFHTFNIVLTRCVQSIYALLIHENTHLSENASFLETYQEFMETVTDRSSMSLVKIDELKQKLSGGSWQSCLIKPDKETLEKAPKFINDKGELHRNLCFNPQAFTAEHFASILHVLDTEHFMAVQPDSLQFNTSMAFNQKLFLLINFWFLSCQCSDELLDMLSFTIEVTNYLLESEVPNYNASLSIYSAIEGNNVSRLLTNVIANDGVIAQKYKKISNFFSIQGGHEALRTLQEQRIKESKPFIPAVALFAKKAVYSKEAKGGIGVVFAKGEVSFILSEIQLNISSSVKFEFNKQVQKWYENFELIRLQDYENLYLDDLCYRKSQQIRAKLSTEEKLSDKQNTRANHNKLNINLDLLDGLQSPKSPIEGNKKRTIMRRTSLKELRPSQSISHRTVSGSRSSSSPRVFTSSSTSTSYKQATKISSSSGISDNFGPPSPSSAANVSGNSGDYVPPCPVNPPNASNSLHTSNSPTPLTPRTPVYLPAMLNQVEFNKGEKQPGNANIENCNNIRKKGRITGLLRLNTR